MQSVHWYYHRLKSMSAAEVSWRIRTKLKGYVDRVTIPLGRYPGIDQIAPENIRSANLITQQSHSTAFYQDQFSVAKLTEQANALTSGKISFFNLENCNLGQPINWHADHSASITAPKAYAESIDYRDFSKAGDCKLVWEPNRHHHWLVLARAYHVTQNEAYVTAIIQQFHSWSQENPFGYGMNWRSPLELGVRLINWVWTFDLIKHSSQVNQAFTDKFLHLVYLHCWEVMRKYSQGSSANNHLIGEVAGVYVACRYFEGMPNAEKWVATVKPILCREIMLQSHPDGGSGEQAFGYQFFVIQFFLFCGWIGNQTNDRFPTEYWSRLNLMVAFTRQISAAFHLYPMFGDRDDGYVLNMGAKPDDVKSLLSVFALIEKNPQYALQAGRFSEFAWWLFGDQGGSDFAQLQQCVAQAEPVVPKAFKDSGYYLLASDCQDSGCEMRLLIDVAELGYGAIAAHGHADALSFVLQVNGEPILVDPGTYDYFTYPAWRRFFRSTAAHNTITIDGENQSELLGPFLWGSRANAKLDEWQPTKCGGSISARHDGYERLPDPVTHIRSLEMDTTDKGQLLLVDKLECKSSHHVSMTFQFAPQCQLQMAESNVVHISSGTVNLEMKLPASLNVCLYYGEEDNKYGWFSDGYHRRQPCFTVVAGSTIEASSELKTVITVK